MLRLSLTASLQRRDQVSREFPGLPNIFELALMRNASIAHDNKNNKQYLNLLKVVLAEEDCDSILIFVGGMTPEEKLAQIQDCLLVMLIADICNITDTAVGFQRMKLIVQEVLRLLSIPDDIIVNESLKKDIADLLLVADPMPFTYKLPVVTVARGR